MCTVHGINNSPRCFSVGSTLLPDANDVAVLKREIIQTAAQSAGMGHYMLAYDEASTSMQICLPASQTHWSIADYLVNEANFLGALFAGYVAHHILVHDSNSAADEDLLRQGEWFDSSEQAPAFVDSSDGVKRVKGSSLWHSPRNNTHGGSIKYTPIAREHLGWREFFIVKPVKSTVTGPDAVSAPGLWVEFSSPRRVRHRRRWCQCRPSRLLPLYPGLLVVIELVQDVSRTNAKLAALGTLSRFLRSSENHDTRIQ
ncbi:hypothetical protein OPT61_g1944 [Boeremia exigua]|uniref:Uncharacterized protein n=1 Tax=Boeremia exigua TaxID=749465 RepID=A0ACC2INJ4_9PLEO|nr:hypothetical protein OPT61_g1944 [Boeremia exigua]